MSVEKLFICEYEPEYSLFVEIHDEGTCSINIRYRSEGLNSTDIICLNKEDIRHLIIELENKLEEMEAIHG